jgi:hypothetical protein
MVIQINAAELEGKFYSKANPGHFSISYLYGFAAKSSPKLACTEPVFMLIVGNSEFVNLIGICLPAS